MQLTLHPAWLGGVPPLTWRASAGGSCRGRGTKILRRQRVSESVLWLGSIFHRESQGRGRRSPPQTRWAQHRDKNRLEIVAVMAPDPSHDAWQIRKFGADVVISAARCASQSQAHDAGEACLTGGRG